MLSVTVIMTIAGGPGALIGALVLFVVLLATLGHGLWRQRRGARVVGVVMGVWIIFGVLLTRQDGVVDLGMGIVGVALIVLLLVPSSGAWFSARR